MDVTLIVGAAAGAVVLAVVVLVVRRVLASRAANRRDRSAVRWVMRINDVHLDDVVDAGSRLQVRLHGDGTWRWDRRGRHQYYDTTARVSMWRHAADNMLVDAKVLMPETFQLELPSGPGGFQALLDIAERCQVVHLRLSGTGPVPGERIGRFAISDGSQVQLRFVDGKLGRPRPVNVGDQPSAQPERIRAAQQQQPRAMSVPTSGSGSVAATDVGFVPAPTRVQ